MKSSLQLIGIENGDTQPSLIFEFGTKKYLFNVGESSLRTSLEYKLKLAKLETIFLSQIAWDQIGGLPGMLLTLADAGNKEIAVYGGDNLTHFLASCRNFVFRMSSTVAAHELSEESSNFRDENVDIGFVFLHRYPRKTENKLETPQNFKIKSQIVSQMFNSGQTLSTITTDQAKYQQSIQVYQSAKRNFNDTKLGPTSPSNQVICYIVQANTSKGKFDRDAALLKGAKPGVEFGQLHSGIPIERNGSIIFPWDCSGADKPGWISIIISCPDESYIPSLIKSSHFQPHYARESLNPVKVIVHMIGNKVFDNPAYKSWREKFGTSTQHILITKEHNSKSITFNHSARSLLNLSYLDEKIFKLPFYNNTSAIFNDKNILVARMMMEFHFEPKCFASFEGCLDDFDAALYKKEELSAKYLECVKEVKEMKGDDLGDPQHWKNRVKITTLGTGASMPSKYRNVSSTLISIPSDNAYILLDSGEGTYGQLFRRFGQDQEESVDKVLRKLKIVFISHMHADHHLGLIKILRERKLLFDGEESPPLFIIGPSNYKTWLLEYSGCEDISLDKITFIPSSSIPASSKESTDDPSYTQMLTLTSLTNIKTVSVDHCRDSYALIFSHQEGWKFVYSGDCRPSTTLITHGQNADILIHEATFEASSENEAKKRKHSTTLEAMIVATRMKAGFLLMTHFSQRYAQRGSFGMDGGNVGVGVGLDLMSFGVGDCKKVDGFRRGLEELFSYRED